MDKIQSSTTVAELADLVRQVAERSPLLAGRAEAAALILIGGKLSPIGSESDYFECVGSDDGNFYLVDLASDVCGCTCPDYQRRGLLDPTGRKSCKHVLAAMFWRKLGQRRPSARLERVRRFRPADRRRPARLIARVAA